MDGRTFIEPMTFLSPPLSSSMMGIGTLDSSGVSGPDRSNLVSVWSSVALTPDGPSPGKTFIVLFFFFCHTRKNTITHTTAAIVMITSIMGMATTAGEMPVSVSMTSGVLTTTVELDAGDGVLVRMGEDVGVG